MQIIFQWAQNKWVSIHHFRLKGKKATKSQVSNLWIDNCGMYFIACLHHSILMRCFWVISKFHDKSLPTFNRGSSGSLTTLLNSCDLLQGVSNISFQAESFKIRTKRIKKQTANWPKSRLLTQFNSAKHINYVWCTPCKHMTICALREKLYYFTIVWWSYFQAIKSICLLWVNALWWLF